MHATLDPMECRKGVFQMHEGALIMCGTDGGGPSSVMCSFAILLSPVISSVLVETCGLPWVLYIMFVFVFMQPLAALYSCLHIYSPIRYSELTPSHRRNNTALRQAVRRAVTVAIDLNCGEDNLCSGMKLYKFRGSKQHIIDVLS